MVGYPVFDYTHDRALLFRYGKFRTLAEEMVETMRGAVALGRTNHAVSMTGVVDQCR